MDTVMERETLEAFVDGALSPEDSARIVLHLADCPSDATYVDALMELNALLGAAYAAPLNDAIPERIRAAIFPTPASAAPAPRRGDARRGWRPAPGGRRRTLGLAAMAAAAALVVGVAVRTSGPDPQVQIAGAIGADDELRVALEERPSGEVPGAGDERITLIATFRDEAGRPCREYEILHDAARAVTRGVACRTPENGWATEVAVASRLPSPTATEAFVPAEGASSAALDAALDRLGAGMLLNPEEERTLIARSWGN